MGVVIAMPIDAHGILTCLPDTFRSEVGNLPPGTIVTAVRFQNRHRTDAAGLKRRVLYEGDRAAAYADLMVEIGMGHLPADGSVAGDQLPVYKTREQRLTRLANSIIPNNQGGPTLTRMEAKAIAAGLLAESAAVMCTALDEGMYDRGHELADRIKSKDDESLVSAEINALRRMLTDQAARATSDEG